MADGYIFIIPTKRKTRKDSFFIKNIRKITQCNIACTIPHHFTYLNLFIRFLNLKSVIYVHRYTGSHKSGKNIQCTYL